MTEDEYRQLALSLPEAAESSHMRHPDFRVRGKIFATLSPNQSRGVVLLTREQQEILTASEPKIFNLYLADGDSGARLSSISISQMRWLFAMPC